MKHARRPLAQLLRVATLSTLLGMSLAHAADDYSDITQLLRAGKAQDALAKADQRISTNPRDPQLRFLRGVAQADIGKQTDAISTFTKLTEDYPELPEPYNNLAVLYANQNQLDKARTALEMAIRTNPAYATAHENLGDIYAKLAGQAYNKALQLDASQAGTLRPKLALIRELFSVDAKSAGAKGGATVARATGARSHGCARGGARPRSWRLPRRCPRRSTCAGPRRGACACASPLHPRLRSSPCCRTGPGANPCPGQGGNDPQRRQRRGKGRAGLGFRMGGSRHGRLPGRLCQDLPAQGPDQPRRLGKGAPRAHRGPRQDQRGCQ